MKLGINDSLLGIYFTKRSVNRTVFAIAQSFNMPFIILDSSLGPLIGLNVSISCLAENSLWNYGDAL
jgi:hypothetical protein